MFPSLLTSLFAHCMEGHTNPALKVPPLPAERADRRLLREGPLHREHRSGAVVGVRGAGEHGAAALCLVLGSALGSTPGNFDASNWADLWVCGVCIVLVSYSIYITIIIRICLFVIL